MIDRAKLTLGPILFHWPAAVKRDFYFRIADEAPVDVVYVGEVVCSKRAPFFNPHLPLVMERLARAGKEVIHSTLALVMTAREISDLRTAATQEGMLIEANDLGCAALFSGRPHAIGPFINVYNEGTLKHLVRRGAVSVTLPFELSNESIRAIAGSDLRVTLEVQAFGRIPLALSARCYHARACGLHKNSCAYVCEADLDGMVIETLEGRPFLALNGTQTMSYTLGNLVTEVERLRGMGIDRFRLSPHDVDMVAVAKEFRAVLDGRRTSRQALERLSELVTLAPFSNGFYHGREGAAWIGTDEL